MKVSSSNLDVKFPELTNNFRIHSSRRNIGTRLDASIAEERISQQQRCRDPKMRLADGVCGR